MIYDSVKDIVDSCDEMLSTVESGSERVDLQYAAKDLSSVLNRLKDEYAKEEDLIFLCGHYEELTSVCLISL